MIGIICVVYYIGVKFSDSNCNDNYIVLEIIIV